MLAESFLKQIFLDGVFHADPHPGNILVMKNKLGLLDFGIAGRVDDIMKDRLGNLLISVVNKDPDGIVDAMASLDLVDPSISKSQLKEEIIEELGEYYDVPLEKMDLAEIFFKCISIARRNGIRIPKNFVLLAKCLVTLKGVCAMLDPSFNIVQESRPFMQKLVEDRTKPKNIFRRLMSESSRFALFVREIPEQTRKFYGLMNKADTALDIINRDISALTSEIRKETIRLILGVIIAALIISASFTVALDSKLSHVFVVLAILLLIYLFFTIASDGIFRRK